MKIVLVSIDELKTYPQQRMPISFNQELSGVSSVKPVVGDLILSLSSSGLWLKGRVKTLLKVSCDRCLHPFFQSLSVDLDERFVYPSDRMAARERELTKADFVEPIPKDGVLDITDIVYQAVTLALPYHPLCGPDCPGPKLSDTAGEYVSLNPTPQMVKTGGVEGDPRWKNLKTLFPKSESDEKS